jgi:flagellum-specific peptidoglycan hydrolase FlgJ
MSRDKKSCIEAVILCLLAVLIVAIYNMPKKKNHSQPKSNFTIEEKLVDNRPQAINDYFQERSMPIVGSGEKFVKEADEHGIDWRLLAAIAVRESSGGKRMPAGSNNPFGWNSGDYYFESLDEAIAYISDKFENGKYYTGKDTFDILATYNPPTVNKNYPAEVIAIMDKISNQGQ